MSGFIIRIIYFAYLVYIIMAAFISIRDITTTKYKTLYITLFGIAFGLVVLLFFTTYMSALALPITLLISLPIFFTDKRRNWDLLDQAFRWVSLVAVLIALYLFANYYFFR